MREIAIGDVKVRVRATPLALFYYRQAFGSDLTGDMMKMEAVKQDKSKLDMVSILQMAWAMAKADAGPGKQFSSFEDWLAGLDGLVVGDGNFMGAVMEEAADGFFRGSGQPQHPAQRRKRKR